MRSAAGMDNLLRWNGGILVPRRPDRRDAGEPRSAQRALARHLPADRRELPRHRRAVGSRNISRLIATPLSPASVRNVMSDLEQLGLVYAAHLGRPAADGGGAALLRRRADGDRRSRRIRPSRDGGQGRGRRQVHGGGAEQSLRMLSGLTRAAGVVLAAKSNVRLKHRVRAARAGARAGDPGRRGRPGREPHLPFRPGCRPPRSRRRISSTRMCAATR